MAEPRLVLRSFSVVLVLFSVGRAANAADPKPARPDRFQALVAEYDRKVAEAEFPRSKKQPPSIVEYSKRFLALAKENPGDDVAFDALVWIVENYDSGQPRAQLDEAIDLIEKHFFKSPRLKAIIPSLADSDSRKAGALVEKLAEKGENRDVRGLASFCLAYSRYGKYAGGDPKALAAIEALLERVGRDYADVKLEDDKTLGKLADAQLYEVKYLQPGKVAPDIEGTEVNGKRMKLSDFRGKVVMLVFWGSWCGPCMAEVPHERKLMDTYVRRPFTVVGVNSGDSQIKAVTTIKNQKMTWPSFLDGAEGPIVERWNVSAFPTVYVLDAKGVIRVKYDLDPSDFEKTIAKLVKEAESK